MAAMLVYLYFYSFFLISKYTLFSQQPQLIYNTKCLTKCFSLAPFVMVHQHGCHAIVLWNSRDWFHTLHRKRGCKGQRIVIEMPSFILEQIDHIICPGAFSAILWFKRRRFKIGDPVMLQEMELLRKNSYSLILASLSHLKASIFKNRYAKRTCVIYH